MWKACKGLQRTKKALLKRGLKNKDIGVSKEKKITLSIERNKKSYNREDNQGEGHDKKNLFLENE